MAALPFMQLYVADYLADTAHLSAPEHGAYLLLMFNYWQRGEAFQARDEAALYKKLASVARMSVAQFKKVAPALEEYFEVTPTQWHHVRIERDLEAVMEKSDKARMAGKASAQKRFGHLDSGNAGVLNLDATPIEGAVEPMLSERLTHVEQPLNHTDTDTDKDKEGNTNTHPKTRTSAKTKADHSAQGQVQRKAVEEVGLKTPEQACVQKIPQKTCSENHLSHCLENHLESRSDDEPDQSQLNPLISKTKLTARDLHLQGVDAQKAAEFLTLRREKRLPFTPTAWEAMLKEGDKLGWHPKDVVEKCLEKGWGGFQAQWVTNAQQNGARASPQQPNKQIALEERNRAIGEEWLKNREVLA